MPRLSKMLLVKSTKDKKHGKVFTIVANSTDTGSPICFLDSNEDCELTQAGIRVSPETAKKLIKELQKFVRETSA